MLALNDKKIFIASDPIDFRMSIDSLARYVAESNKSYLHDGSIYVFTNKKADKVKCLFYDRNGFVLYYKRLEGMRFRVGKYKGGLVKLTPEQLDLLLGGFDPHATQRIPLLIENDNG